ncbi:hypothetical protein [Microbacterium sp. PMB16]|uniref:hypothetical protein n=1 Tax=Microbacterium sp. PMB16 TaxID=3120157 RepID=UPI003F4B3CF8
MLPSSPEPLPRVRAERMLITRIVIAVGLALLLVVGAWSTSHGKADVHASLCLATGVSHTAASSAEGHDSGTSVDAVASVDALTADAALCLVAVLCVVALVLLFRRLLGRRSAAPEHCRPRTTLSSRAGPASLFSALTLTQLSISRT